ncbi:MAG: PH domain-containing protein [Oligoflexia bacterium]|nr:PH domain-containing protein [Oligoflexia bacterium]
MQPSQQASQQPSQPDKPTASLADPSSYQALDPRVVTLWRLQRLVSLGLVGLPMAVAIAVGLNMIAPSWVGLSAGLLLVLWRLILAMLWPTLMYRHFRYRVRDHDLLVQNGVLFRRWTSVPHSRIQHVDTRQGPLERLLGLQRLAVYTAAGMSADGSVPGLAEQDAERLRDQLSRRGGDDGV